MDNTHLTRQLVCARLHLMGFNHIAPIARERFLKILHMAGFRSEEPEPKEEYDAWIEAQMSKNKTQQKKITYPSYAKWAKRQAKRSPAFRSASEMEYWRVKGTS